MRPQLVLLSAVLAAVTVLLILMVIANANKGDQGQATYLDVFALLTWV